jgi:hypothetical protein
MKVACVDMAWPIEDSHDAVHIELYLMAHNRHGMRRPAPAAPQVVACLQLEERASAAGLWPGDEFALLATACVGQLYDLVMVVIYANGGLLCERWQ